MEYSDKILLEYYYNHIKPAVESGNKAYYHSCCRSITKRSRKENKVFHLDSMSIAHLFKRRDDNNEKIEDIKEFFSKDDPFWMLPAINRKTCYGINPTKEEVGVDEGYSSFLEANNAQEDFGTGTEPYYTGVEKTESITKPTSDQLQEVTLGNVFQYLGKRNMTENEKESLTNSKNFCEQNESQYLITRLEKKLAAAQIDK